MIHMSNTKRNPNDMEISGHMHELRNRLLVVLVVFILSCIFAYSNYDVISGYVLSLGIDAGYSFAYIAPQEAVLQQLRIVFMLSFLVAVPVLVFEAMAFVLPIFDSGKAKALLWTFSGLSILLFYAGILFSYFLLLPICMKYLCQFSESTQAVAQMISLEKYVSFITSITTCMGVIFEMPLMCVALSRTGLLTVSRMKQGFSIVAVVIFIIAAVITPPDVVSQILVAVPMLFLYQFSILLVYIFRKRETPT